MTGDIVDFGWTVEAPPGALLGDRPPAAASDATWKLALESCVLRARYEQLDELVAVVAAQRPALLAFAQLASVRASMRQKREGPRTKALDMCSALVGSPDSTMNMAAALLALLHEPAGAERAQKALPRSADMPASLAALRLLVEVRLAGKRDRDAARHLLVANAWWDSRAVPVALRGRLVREQAHHAPAPESSTLHARAQALFQACGDVEGQLDSQVSLARQHMESLDLDLASAQLRAAAALIEQHEKTGSTLGHKRAEVAGWLAEIALLSRAFDEAEKQAKIDVSLSTELVPQACFHAKLRLAKVCIRRAAEEPTKARFDAAQAALRAAAGDDDPASQGWTRQAALAVRETALLSALKNEQPRRATPQRKEEQKIVEYGHKDVQGMDAVRRGEGDVGAELDAMSEAPALRTLDALLVVACWAGADSVKRAALERARLLLRTAQAVALRALVAERLVALSSTAAEAVQQLGALEKTGGLAHGKNSPVGALAKAVTAQAKRLTAKRWPAVLITGQSGTGKELFARHIGDSTRANKPFVALNCGALPELLIESELFGCVKGAFSGADRARPGAFRDADGGTLFLDEIGELPLPGQAKLLRALQERAVRPVGASHEIAFDAQVICATNQDLWGMVRDGRFREDLYYRISTMVFSLPPLKERGSDLLLIAGHLANEIGRELFGSALALTAAARGRIEQHGWPGNVRELRSVLTAAAMGSKHTQIDAPAIDAVLAGRRSAAAQAPHSDAAVALATVKDLNMKSSIQPALASVALLRANGDKKAAAKLIDVGQTTVDGWRTRAK